MESLIVLQTGIVLMVLTEKDLPEWLKRTAWIALVIAGIVMGALEKLG